VLPSAVDVITRDHIVPVIRPVWLLQLKIALEELMEAAGMKGPGRY
jgi:hypothetical protein